jgi:hypothetical protein
VGEKVRKTQVKLHEESFVSYIVTCISDYRRVQIGNWIY